MQPHWQTDLAQGKCPLPAPIYPERAALAQRYFGHLQLVDVPGSPRMAALNAAQTAQQAPAQPTNWQMNVNTPTGGFDMGKIAQAADMVRQSRARMAALQQPQQQLAYAQPQQNEQMLADGGRVQPKGFVRGAGTGTSDSIKARLSNGEYVLPADTVQAIGVGKLDALKAATHTPVAQQGAKGNETYLANGGQPDDDMAKWKAASAALKASDAKMAAQNAAPTQNAALTSPTPAAQPVAAQQDSGRTWGDRALTAALVPSAATIANAAFNTDYFTKAGDEARKDADYNFDRLKAEGKTAQAYGSYAGDQMKGAALDLISPAATALGGAANFAQGFLGIEDRKPAASATPANQTTTPPAAKADTPPPAANAAPPAANTANTANTAPPPSMGANGVLPSGVYQHGAGNYSDSPTGMGFSAGFTGQPNAQNSSAANALSNRYGAQALGAAALQMNANTQAPQVQAPMIANSTNDWQARNNLRNAAVSTNSIMYEPYVSGSGKRAQVITPNNPAMDAYKAALSADNAAQAANSSAQVSAMGDNTALMRDTMGINAGNARANAENALKAQQLNNQETQAQFERNAKGFDIAGAQRKQYIMGLMDAAKTPEERQALINQYPDILENAKGDMFQGIEIGGTKNVDGSTNPGGLAVVDKAKGGVKIYNSNGEVNTGNGTAPLKPTDANIQALKNNPALAAQFNAAFGANAAEKILAQK